MSGLHFGNVERTSKDEDMSSRLSYVTNKVTLEMEITWTFWILFSTSVK